MKYMVKPEYADQIFSGECDTSYVEECMKNGMPEEDVQHLIREFGKEVINMFEVEEEAEMAEIKEKTWQAIVSYMDDDIREDVHLDMAPCSNEDFLREYLKRDPGFAEILRTEFNMEV